MIVKNYRAATREEAEKRAYEELGPETLILLGEASEEGGYEVTAAVEGEEEERPAAVATDDPELEQLLGFKISEVMQSPILKERPRLKTASFLTARGIDPQIAAELEEKLAAAFPELENLLPGTETTAYLNALRRALAQLIQTAPPPKRGKERATVMAAIGPTGGGKSTALVKLAFKEGFHNQVKTALIGYEPERPWALEQTRSLAEHLGVIFSPAATLSELLKQIEAHRHFGLILIDTPGISPCSEEEAGPLAEALKRIGPYHPLFTFPATLQERTLYEMAEALKPFGEGRFLMTRLDELKRYGIFANLGRRTEVPLTYLSTGRRVPDDLDSADADELARNILLRNAHEQY